MMRAVQVYKNDKDRIENSVDTCVDTPLTLGRCQRVNGVNGGSGVIWGIISLKAHLLVVFRYRIYILDITCLYQKMYVLPCLSASVNGVSTQVSTGVTVHPVFS